MDAAGIRVVWHYMLGHEVRIYSAIVGHVGSLHNLRETVERYTGKPVNRSYE